MTSKNIKTIINQTRNEPSKKWIKEITNQKFWLWDLLGAYYTD